MSPPTALQKAEAERSIVKDTIEVIDRKYGNRHIVPLDEHTVSHLLQTLVTTEADLMRIHKDIMKCIPTDPKPHQDEFKDNFEAICRLQSGLNSVMSLFPRTSVSTPPPTAAGSVPTHNISLPKISLPTFTGNIQEWVAFRDMFVTTVDKNSTLSKVQKLTYLKTTVTGEAARLINTLSLSEANYDTAWKALTDRYENDRELLFSVMKSLFNQSPVTSASSTQIRSLVDSTRANIRTFTLMNGKIEHMFLYLIYSKIDTGTKELWYQTTDAKTLPDLDSFFSFLEQRSMALSAGSTSRFQPKVERQKAHSHHLQPSGRCSLSCPKPHPLFRCEKFLKMPIQERNQHVKRSSLCYNCLSAGHSVSQCRSSHTCKTCGKKHNTLLHFSTSNPPRNDNANHDNATTDNVNRVASHHGYQITDVPSALLATAVVKIEGRFGESMCRALLDSGSSTSFITAACAKKLGLTVRDTNTEVVGLSSAPVGSAAGIVSFSMKTHFPSQHHYIVNALVIPTVTSKLPPRSMTAANWSHLHALQLADPLFHTSASVDILLGADIFWELLESGKKTGDNNQPIAVKSTLGWLVSGQIQQPPPTAVNSFITNVQLSQQLEKFWDTESAPTSDPVFTPDEQACENNFIQTVSRDLTGRFNVSIPWKNPLPVIGKSRENAVRRLQSMERRLSKNEEGKLYKQEYIKFMNEYLSLGHMQPVSSPEMLSAPNSTYYIPHHFVLKSDSTTTKFRVVFDGSSKSSTGVSLNDAMMVGPTVQSTLFDIMLRFRLHSVVFTADVEKMFRQIKLNEDDSNFHRIVWRDDESQEIKDYRLTTVTYGTAAATYLSTRSIQQLAVEEKINFPKAADVAEKDFYVDDLMSGNDNLSTAKETVSQLIPFCSSGGFCLRKWTSNSCELLSTIPEDLREKNYMIPVDEDATVKTLGIFWHPQQDVYLFKINIPKDETTNYSKRIILSQMSKLFDPIGWLAPVTIRAKIIMQDIWKLQTDWDVPLPLNIQQQWNDYKSALPALQQIKIKRQYLMCKNNLHLIGFADVSEKALAAVVYVCNISPDDLPVMSLVSSKTRVAPLKSVTLPRLELNAAVLLSELLVAVQQALKVDFLSVRAFTDSSITLSWINSDANRWKTYIRNRVARIQTLTPTATWYHVRGDINPADCASRGLSPEDLKTHHLWWTGSPAAITNPSTASTFDTTLHEEEAKTVTCFHQEGTVLNIITKFSSLSLIVKIVAMILRAQNNYKARKNNDRESRVGEYNSEELKEAKLAIIKHVQSIFFSNEYQLLQKREELPSKNKLAALAPFVDTSGVLCVGGRLRNANIPTEQKHPALLPRHHHITNLIIKEVHETNLHAGPQLTLAVLNQQYWITRGKDTIRQQLKKCIRCTRLKAKVVNQMMADLPAARVNISRPFDKCGVDYAGPFILKNAGRSNVSFKAWLAIFVCFVTRCIHLEVASSLSTEGFIAAFRRFIARRGKPTVMHSDNGTNFVGANKKLIEMTTVFNQTEVAALCAAEGIQWRFNPPGAPHFGGLWEAGVKSVKHHLHRVMSDKALTYEEMYTLVVQIEAILNSRPLTPISSDPNELLPLTPAHFLIGAPFTSLPDPDLQDINVGRLDRWNLLQSKQQSFWKRWSSEYVSRLHQRPKWLSSTRDFKVNDIVIIKEDNLPPGKWKLGRVMDIHPGKDNRVRVVTLRTEGGELKRPSNKICLLPIDV